MNLAKLWENHVFKKRYLISYSKNPCATDIVDCAPMSSLDIEPLLPGLDETLKKYLNMRQNSSAWIFFSYQVNGKLAGYSFLHVPVTDEWNDALPTHNGSARVASVFVNEKHRGRRIAEKLLSAMSKYGYDNSLSIWAVVEASNSSSLKLFLRNGYIMKKNYLIKIWKRNVFSILTHPFKIYFLLGDKRAKR